MKYFLFIAMTFFIWANDDLKLVTLAYENGLKPVPSNFKSLVLTLDTNSEDLSKEKIALGKKLFFEKDLSIDRDISCASCHSFDKGGADSIPTAIGHDNQKNPFHLNTPTVLNTAFSKKLFWNGSSDTLRDQAKGPMQASFEMSITPDLAEKRIKGKNQYVKQFQKVYGKDSITFENIANAIAAYEKTIVTRGRYDDFLLGDFDALNEKEKKGLKLFVVKSCVGCHNGIGLGGQVLRKFPLSYHQIWSMERPVKIKALQKRYRNFLNSLNDHKIEDYKGRINYLKSKMGDADIELLRKGLFSQVDENEVLKVMTTSACTKCHKADDYKIKEEIVKKVSFPFENRGKFLGAEDPKKYFRVPLLRNVVRTKPYFHNGSVKKLEEAIKIMGIHQSRTDINDDDIEDIVAFLKAVDGKLVDYEVDQYKHIYNKIGKFKWENQ